MRSTLSSPLKHCGASRSQPKPTVPSVTRLNQVVVLEHVIERFGRIVVNVRSSVRHAPKRRYLEQRPRDAHEELVRNEYGCAVRQLHFLEAYDETDAGIGDWERKDLGRAGRPGRELVGLQMRAFTRRPRLASISYLPEEDLSMRKVNIHEAKTTLSQLIEAAENGEDVLIARAGRPVARLTRVRTGRKGIKLGTLKGMFKKVSAEFDAPLPQSVRARFGDGPLEP